MKLETDDMRWNLPAKGDERIVDKFLLFPCAIRGEVRWLERAMIKQRAVNWGWEDIMFLDDKDENDGL